MADTSPIEGTVEVLCKTITKKTSEFWEERNRAIVELTNVINEHEGSSRLGEIFNANVFRMLVEPVKLMVLDLRSQQVRDTCTFLTRLSIITRDLMRQFLRETFESIFLAVKVPNRVMSSYVDDCIISLIRHTTFKSAISLIAADMKDSRSKGEYMNEMLLCWDIQEKEAESFQDAIRIGLEDASVRCRELARFAYLNFRDLFPRRADRIKADISNPSLSARLEKEEEIHDQEKESGEYLNGFSHPIAASEEVDAILQESRAINPKSKSHRTASDEADAISEIQALIRGNLVRRQSSRYSVCADTFDGSKRGGATRALAGGVGPVSPLVERDEDQQSSSLTSPPGHLVGSPDKSTFKYSSGSADGTEVSRASGSIQSGEDDGQHDFNFKVGMIASVKGRDPPVLGTVQFVGQTAFASGYWIGLRLDAPLGKNEGSVQGIQYFKCLPLHGLFVRPEQLTIVSLGDSLNEHTQGISSENPSKSCAENLRETLNVAYALKHKLTHTMNIMNQQIEAIENFESRIQGDSGVSDHDCSTFLCTISECHAEEERVCREFGDILPAVSEFTSR